MFLVPEMIVLAIVVQIFRACSTLFVQNISFYNGLESKVRVQRLREPTRVEEQLKVRSSQIL